MIGRRGFISKVLTGLMGMLGLGAVPRNIRAGGLNHLFLGENAKRSVQVTPLLWRENTREGYIQFSKDLDLRNPNHARFCQGRLDWHFGKPARGFKRISSRYTVSADGNRYDYKIVDQEMHS